MENIALCFITAYSYGVLNTRLLTLSLSGKSSGVAELCRRSRYHKSLEEFPEQNAASAQCHRNRPVFPLHISPCMSHMNAIGRHAACDLVLISPTPIPQNNDSGINSLWRAWCSPMLCNTRSCFLPPLGTGIVEKECRVSQLPRLLLWGDCQSRSCPQR